MRTKNAIKEKEEKGLRIMSHLLVINLIIFAVFLTAGVLTSLFASQSSLTASVSLQMSILGRALLLAGSTILILTGIFIGVIIFVVSSHDVENAFFSISVSSAFGALFICLFVPSLVLISAYIIIPAIVISGLYYLKEQAGF